MKPADNRSNMSNSNRGTSGTNRQYDQAQGNRGKQMNPTYQAPSSKPSAQGGSGSKKK